MASYKTGPLAGIEYSTERTKRDAREYYQKNHIVLSDAQARVFARGGLSTAQRQRDKNKRVFAERWAQQEVARRGGNIYEVINRTLASNSEFSRVWRRASHGGFEPGTNAFTQLVQGAGMMTGAGDEKGETHYQRYVKIKWDDIDSMGEKSIDEVLAAYDQSA